MDDYKNKSPLISREIKRTRFRITPVQIIVLGYIAFAIVGTLLLMLPFSLQQGVRLGFVDALFTATSAVSVTGLTVVSTKDTFSLTGRVVLVFLLQFGGLGIMTLGTLVYIMRGNQISLRERLMIRVDQNQVTLQGLVVLLLFIFKAALILELVLTMVLATHFWLFYQMSFINALGMGFFHSVAGFTNAGFDLFGNSLQSFQRDYLVQSVIMFLMLAGAIGFPVLVELHMFYKTRRLGMKFRFSLFFKVAVSMYMVLLAAGFLVILLAEMSGSLAGMPWHQKIMTALFQSLTTRSGGLSTVDVGVFHQFTLLFMCILMFIGASPSSCGGGMRTTTLAVIALNVIAFVRGQNSVKVFHRELYQEDIMRAFRVFFVAVLLVTVSFIVLAAIEPFTFTELLFDVCSAFGTAGLSMGITGELSSAGKMILILLMFIGRIGILSLLLLFHRQRPEDRYHFVKERIIIGQ